MLGCRRRVGGMCVERRDERLRKPTSRFLKLEFAMSA